MKRIAFTIIFNGLHHLKHFNYAEYLIQNLDLWVIVEGGALNKGSTKWCKPIPQKWHDGEGHSIDGTLDYLQDLQQKYKDTITLLWGHGFWESKDEMVNTAIDFMSAYAPCYLWEIDADEIWDINQMQEAEKMLLQQSGKTGIFHANYYIGQNLLAKGEWGEGLKLPYRRLWYWKGERFKTHEPPLLEGGNREEILLPQKFNHYAYYYEQDVKFKNDYYIGHEGIYERWLELQKETNFPQPISRLIVGPWGKTKTEIVRNNKNDHND